MCDRKRATGSAGQEVSDRKCVTGSARKEVCASASTVRAVKCVSLSPPESPALNVTVQACFINLGERRCMCVCFGRVCIAASGFAIKPDWKRHSYWL